MKRGVLAACVLVASAPVARAELWMSTMGNLMKDATRIEILDVTAVNNRAVDGTLAVAVRSANKVGDKIHMELGQLPAPKAGDRLLVVCDSECPRAIGVERAGQFSLIAQEMGDGAYVTPNIVKSASLVALAARKPVPDLCIRGTVELLDDSARPAFDVHVSATDGSGSGTLGKRKVTAGLTVQWFSSHDGAVLVRLANPGKGGVELVADAVTTEKDGCTSGAFMPSRPLARTAASLDAAFDGALTARDLAKGTLETGAATNTFTFTVKPDGTLDLASDLAQGAVTHVQTEPKFGVGFATRTGSPNDPELFFEFSIGATSGREHSATFAKVLKQAPEAKVYWLKGGSRTALGTVTLTYVKEK